MPSRANGGGFAVTKTAATTPGAICTSHAGESIGQSLDSEEGRLRIARASQTSDQTVSDQLIFAHALGLGYIA
jgi:hypothetical protein